MNQREKIDAFLASGRIAIAGVSRKETKSGTYLFKELQGKGLSVVGINPHMTTVLGEPCYASVEELPADVDALITVVKPGETVKVIRAAWDKGIRKVWMHLGSESEEALSFCKEKGMEYVAKECPLMYCDPVTSIHRFHRGINKVFGKYHRATV